MKSTIISKLEDYLKLDSVLQISDEFNDLTEEFYQILREEDHQWEIEKLERIEAGEKPEFIERAIDNDTETIKNLIREVKVKRKIEIDNEKEYEENNLKTKKKLIQELKDLIQNEENIGKAIIGIKDIRVKWVETGEVPRKIRQDLQKEYSNLIETFNYNIRIYKELKDHDLNRNLALKKEIIEKLKELLKIDLIKEVEEKLNALQNEWSDIGGTKQEDWEIIKEEYWTAINQVYEKIKAFYEKRKEEQIQNIQLKKQLIEKAIEIAEKEIEEHKDWQKETENLLAIQEEWKKIGFGPKEENKLIWKDFRKACNQFFEKKKDFYKDRNKEFDGVKEEKEKLIESIKQLKDSTDWKETTQKIVQLQNQWKKLGSAGPKFENKLWKEFRGPIDFFFDAKEKFFKDLDSENEGNLKLKQELIQKIKDYSVSEDVQKTIADLKQFSDDFKNIGNVPFAEKDKIYNEYKTALDEKYGQIKLEKSEKDKVLYQAKIDGLLESPNKDRAIDNEKNHLRTKLNELVKELAQYENNLSFFANADEKNPLFVGVKKNIQQTKDEVDRIKQKLKLLSNSVHE